ncbi:hypothetical protein D3C71_1204670 [compost metagenome]
MLAEIGNRHVRAFARKQHGHRAAYARIAAGDQRVHALELAAALVAWRLIARRLLHLAFLARLFQMLAAHGRGRFLAVRAGCRGRGRRLAFLGLLVRCVLLALDVLLLGNGFSHGGRGFLVGFLHGAASFEIKKPL